MMIMIEYVATHAYTRSRFFLFFFSFFLLSGQYNDDDNDDDDDDDVKSLQFSFL